MRNVRQNRRSNFERFIKRKIFRRRSDIFCATNHVSHFHLEIINNMRKIISWQTVRLDQNKIIKRFRTSRKLAHNGVVPSISLDFGRFEAKWHSKLPLWRIFWAMIAIQKRAFFELGPISKFFNLLWRVRISISQAFFDHFFSPFQINFTALSLVIRPKIAFFATFAIWTFAPIQAKPTQSFEHQIFGTLDKSSLIRIFNSQNKITASLLGNQIRIKCASNISNVNVASWTRRKTSSCFHSIILPDFKEFFKQKTSQKYF